MIQINVTRNLIGIEDLLTGVGTVDQVRGAGTATTPITKINAQNFPYDADLSLGEKLDELETLARSLSVVDEDGNFLTGYLNTSEEALALAGRLWLKTPADTPTVAELWYGSVRILKYNKTTGDLIIPDNVNYIAADTALSTALTAYINAQNAILDAAHDALVASLKEGAFLDVGTSANELVQLNADAKLPAVNGSLLTNLPDTLPIGSIIMVPYSTPDTNYLECNGQAVSRATYATLFSKLGVTYGSGDGTNTFNIPDYRGEFLRVWDDGRGVDSGRALGSLQSDANKSHYHGLGKEGINANNGSTITVGSDSSAAANAQTGYSGDSESRPRNISVMAQIKAL
jgi:microcystin-dependent protein